MLIRGELQPGQKLSETDLCDRFQVSRTPLREALRVLAYEGVLVPMPHRGMIVATVNVHDVHNHFPVMAALEGLAGELACRHATQQDRDDMRKLHEAMMHHYSRREEADYLHYGRMIHQRFIDLADNPVLSDAYAQILIRIRQVRYVTSKPEELWQKSVLEHDAIQATFEAGNARILGDLLREHVGGTVQEIALQTTQRHKPTTSPPATTPGGNLSRSRHE